MIVKYYRNLPQYLFLLLLFVNPFVFWPFSEIVFEVPKVWFVNRFIELLGITGLFFFFSLKKTESNSKLLFWIFAFFIVSAVSSLIGVDIYKSLVGNYYRADGLFTLVHFLILVIFLHLYFHEEWLKNVVKTFAYSNCALSIWVLVNFILAFIDKQIFESWDGAVGVNFGNPNFLAGYLLVTLPFSYYFYRKKKFIYKLFFIFQTFSILITRAWVGIIGAILFISYLILNRYKNKKCVFAVGLVLVTAMALFIGNYKRIHRKDSLVAESRERIIIKGLMAFREKPIMGWGWANFDYAFDSFDWPIKLNDDVYVDKAHSNFLEILVTTGFVGSLMYLGLLYTVGKNLYFSKVKYKKYLLAVYILYILHSQTNVISVSEEIIFWTLVGVSTKLGVYRSQGGVL